MALRWDDHDLRQEGPAEKPDALTPEEDARIEASLASARRGELLTADEVGRRLQSLLTR